MPSLIDIRRRLRSVKSTQQITKAMKMVAAAKLRRAQDRVVGARPYAAQLSHVLSSVMADAGASQQPLLAEREEKKVIVVVIAGDRGLCGAFNTNVNRAVGKPSSSGAAASTRSPRRPIPDSSTTCAIPTRKRSPASCLRSSSPSARTRSMSSSTSSGRCSRRS